ncbi:hypothetical protein [Sphingomonas sp.]|uniref:hypothetical protein n=1 Tax=Sphingomonas sp. TaxID=28214 RepID=UPI0035BBD8FF
MSTTSQPQDRPGSADAEGDHVVLDGPAGVAVTMTPQAAAETARRLDAAARRAAKAPPHTAGTGEDD